MNLIEWNEMILIWEKVVNDSLGAHNALMMRPMNEFFGWLNNCGQAANKMDHPDIPERPAPACDVRDEEEEIPSVSLTALTWRAANHFLIDIL